MRYTAPRAGKNTPQAYINNLIIKIIMKLHLPTALFVFIAGTACVMADTVPTGAITVTHNTSETGPFYGLDSTQNGSGVSSITTNITEGADLEKSLAGGLEFNHKTLENGYYADTDGVTLKDGVTINMTGGTATSLKGGNCINTSLYLDAIRNNLGDALNVGSIEINVSGGTLGSTEPGAEEAIMGGGGRHCGTASSGGIEVNISGGIINNKVYAGTNAGSTGYTKLNISGGTINADVYGGGRRESGVVLRNSTVTISGGTINGNVYAAGDQDTVKGNATVNITGDGVKLDNIVSGTGTNGSKVLGETQLFIDGESSLGQVKDFEFILVRANTEIGSIENAADGTLLRNLRTLTVKNDLSVNKYQAQSSSGSSQLKVGGNMTVDNLVAEVPKALVDVGGKLTVNTGQVSNATITADNIEVNGSFKLKNAVVGGHSDGVESLITVSETGNLTLDGGSQVEDITVNGGRLTVMRDYTAKTGSITLNEGSELYFDLAINYRPELPTATIDLGENDLFIGNDVTITVAAVDMSKFDDTELVLFKNIGDIHGSNLTVKFTDRNVAYDAIVSVRDGKVVAIIPEPTTATMSLLALAALAARRRRR